jgi:hypothetical protein
MLAEKGNAFESLHNMKALGANEDAMVMTQIVE